MRIPFAPELRGFLEQLREPFDRPGNKEVMLGEGWPKVKHHTPEFRLFLAVGKQMF
jgi:hypothetical protein